MADELLLTVTLLAAAFAPPLLYMYIVRNTETCRREPWSGLLMTFLWGGTIAVVISVLLESVAMALLYNEFSPLAKGFWNFQPYDPVLETVLLAVIVAPLVEEAAKASGIPRRRILEREDGLIYGAAIGLGFAGTENLLYLVSALSDSMGSFLATAALRAVTSTVLHASATAVAGYGISRSIFMGRMGRHVSWLPYLAMAMVMHGLFNLFASLSDLVSVDQVAFALLGLVLAFILAMGAFLAIRRQIRELDRAGGACR